MSVDSEFKKFIFEILDIFEITDVPTKETIFKPLEVLDNQIKDEVITNPELIKKRDELKEKDKKLNEILKKILNKFPKLNDEIEKLKKAYVKLQGIILYRQIIIDCDNLIENLSTAFNDNINLVDQIISQVLEYK
jgi:predicted nuclease with TOPRIM domain